MNKFIRLAILVFSVTSLAIIMIMYYLNVCFIKSNAADALSLLAVMASSASAYLSIRDKREAINTAQHTSAFVKSFRKIIYTDKQLSLMLIQLAVVYQSISLIMK